MDGKTGENRKHAQEVQNMPFKIVNNDITKMHVTPL